MRQRLIDGALLAGLVVVAFAIMWTLFTLGRDPVGSRPPPPSPSASSGDAPGFDVLGVDDAPEPIDPDDADIVALAPGDVEAGDGAPATETSTASETSDVPDAVSAPSESDATSPEPAPLEPLPDGAVPLNRVGFSYVTGGAGACGIVLEAWAHVAVSRDILAELPCGTPVTIQLDDEIDGRSRVDAVVGDTMNPSFSRTVNIYVGEDEPALEYGITSGTLVR